MTVVKLTTKNTWKANQTNILPIAGEVTFDENASIEIDDEKVDIDALIELMPEFLNDIVEPEDGEDLKQKSEENDLGKSGEEDLNPQIEDLKEDSDENNKDEQKVDPQIVRQKLEVKSAAELKELLKQFPEELVKDLKNKAQYIDFLVEQLSK